MAACIGSNACVKEPAGMTFFEKLEMFTDLNERNLRTRTNTLHVSLNFNPSEQLDAITLNQVASSYMEQIGFGEQPYLVYQHFDAAHPHIHIISSLIKPDGKRIPIHYLGKNQSEAARKKIETEFSLVPANGKKKTVLTTPADLTRAFYGKHETKASIARVVSVITSQYYYTSIAELNAALRLFNVTADRGHEHTQMFLKGGLQYTLSDEQGLKVGVPIKASSLPGKPTLKFLERQFEINKIRRTPLRDPLKRIIDAALSKVSTPTDFKKIMNAQGVHVVYRVNESGLIFGITFVDTNRKAVFNGSALGKPYSANAILERLSVNSEQVHARSTGKTSITDKTRQGSEDLHVSVTDGSTIRLTELIEQVIEPSGVEHLSPDRAMKLRKRKRRKRK